MIAQAHGPKSVQVQAPFGRAPQPVVEAVSAISGVGGNGVEEVVPRIGAVARVFGVVEVAVEVVPFSGHVGLVEFGKVGFEVEFSFHLEF